VGTYFGGLVGSGWVRLAINVGSRSVRFNEFVHLTSLSVQQVVIEQVCPFDTLGSASSDLTHSDSATSHNIVISMQELKLRRQILMMN